MKAYSKNSAYLICKLGLFINPKFIELCETYFQKSRLCLRYLRLQLAVLTKSQNWKNPKLKTNYLAVRVIQTIQTVLLLVDSNVKAYLKSPSILLGLFILLFVYPFIGYFHLFIPEDTGIYISSYYPDLFYFSYAIEDAIQPVLLVLVFMLLMSKKNYVKYYLSGPLAFYSVKAYYILTATNNAEYIAPPLNILAITLLTCTIISFIYLSKRIIKRYYHGSRTSNICRLVGIIESPGIDWRDKEGLLKDLISKVKDRESLIYGD